jgi:hypothetical protein
MPEMSITVELSSQWKDLRMPKALKSRLTDLLDKQDLGNRLSARERKEAEALVELSEMLSLLRIETLEAKSKNRKK